MKFLDLNTGYSFDGLWNEDQTRGYVFWFPNEQSTNIVYSMPICIINESNDSLHLTIEDNSIFDFIDETALKDSITLDCCEFYELESDNNDYKRKFSTTTVAQQISNNQFAHIFNIRCKSKNPGEFVCKINIENAGYIKVGADFYEEYEPYDINLSNFGVELPDTIQKAIYDISIHEDYKDNILMNRKYKELLSNYWDIVANKGSYKSLNNSLDWFEWGDLLKIKEIWKRDEAGKMIFDDREVMSIFENKIKDHYGNFIKTSYIALYCYTFNELQTADVVFNNYNDYYNNDNNVAINTIVKLIDSTDDYPAGFYRVIDNKGLQYISETQYDSEGNPKLIENILKWAKNDIRIKLSLLTQFFGTYFLPIHLSILYSTLEDQIYTNTIKGIVGSSICRQDSFGDFNYVSSNIKDGEIFKLDNVKTYVNEKDIFNNLYISKEHESGKHEWILSNEKLNVRVFPNNDDIQGEEFFKNYYVGPGKVIPIKFNIPNQTRKDFIKQTIISINGLKYSCFDKIDVKDNEININFDFLAKEARDYNLMFSFITSTGKTIIKSIDFVVEDVDNLNINVYKVQAKDDSNGFTYLDFSNTYNYRYFFANQPSKIEYDENGPVVNNKCYYMQYLPYMSPQNPLFESYKGIKLNRTVVIKASDFTKYDLTNIRYWFKNYLEFQKKVEDKLTYLVFVSKYFYEELPSHIYEHPEYEIIRNDLVFYPQFHNLIRMQGIAEENYTISQYEAVCCAPEININRNNIKPFKYGHKLIDYEWTFCNSAINEYIYNPSSSRQPFVVKDNGLIKPGYYDICFKYSLSDGIQGECTLNSAFRIKTI